MRIGDLIARQQRRVVSDQARLIALTRTLGFARRLDESRRTIDAWRARCSRPAVSCGGGKDSTALLSLVHQADPEIKVYCADPPNPLPDRNAHVACLARADGGSWRHVAYDWDVAAVLSGEQAYPALLKIKRLMARQREDKIDGLALGIRASESSARQWHLSRMGSIWRTSAPWLTCAPLAQWTAEEVVGYTIAIDRLPLNPVYERLHLAPPLERLRDGTWYPRELADHAGYRPWLAYHYPDCVEVYDQAILRGKNERNSMRRVRGDSG